MVRFSGRHAAGGFTLIELQIAILITVMISLLLAGGLNLATKVWGRITDKRNNAEHVYLVSQFLRNHLGRMQFYLLPMEDFDTPVFTVWGDDSHLRFVAPWVSDYRSDDRLYWWTLRTEINSDTDAAQLILEYSPFQPNEALDPALLSEVFGQKIVIADDIYLEDIAYYGVRDSDDPEWYSEWNPGDTRPMLLQVRIGRHGDDDADDALFSQLVSPYFAAQSLRKIDAFQQ